MKGVSANNQLTRLRLYLKRNLELHDLSAEERDDLSHEYWGLEISERVIQGELESAGHCLTAAAVGEGAFEGPHRICRPNLEGLPVGRLVCSPKAVIKLVEFLYDALPQDPAPELVSLLHKPASWSFAAGSDRIDILEHGNPVSKMLLEQHSTRSFIAALQAKVIFTYLNNHRRFASKAA